LIGARTLTGDDVCNRSSEALGTAKEIMPERHPCSPRNQAPHGRIAP
jgi:hypothetical protein